MQKNEDIRNDNIHKMPNAYIIFHKHFILGNKFLPLMQYMVHWSSLPFLLILYFMRGSHSDGFRIEISAVFTTSVLESDKNSTSAKQPVVL